MKELLFRLCTAHGTPGDEGGAAEVARQALAAYAQVETDRNGNVIAHMGDPKAAKHILFDAHIDQIGMIVTWIDDHGFLKAAPCGGVDRRVLPGSAVKICGKEEITGIICCTPPHLSQGGEDKVPSFDQLYIDTGLTGEKARELIAPGDRILFTEQPKELLHGRVSVPALDDRSGVMALVRCAELLSKEKTLPCRVTFLLSVQEETGAAGAHTAAFSLHPDEAVMVDVSFSTQPGVPREKAAQLGKGTMIGIAPTLCREVTDTLKRLAEEHQVPYQLEVMGGETGTNADAVGVTRGGVRCGLLSIPERYMHTPVEVLELEDIESTARLLALYAKKGGIVHD